MATPTLLDCSEFLEPIAGPDPAGRDLTYEPEYDELREARRSEDDTLQGDWQRKVKVAEWDRVISLGTDLLKERAKDLQIAAWVAEALARRRGFAGMRDGLKLVRAIQDRFWDSYYPRVEDGDLDSRSGPFLFLNGTLPAVVRGLPLTAGYGEEKYSFLRWQESRATANAGIKSPDLMEAMIAEGKITTKQFDDQVAQTPRKFYENLFDDLKETLEALKDLDQSVDKHFGRDAPGLGAIRKAIEECRKPLEPILAAKRAQEPDPDDDTPAGATDETPEGEEAPEVDDVPARPARRRSGSARSSSGPIASAEDARQRIVEAAAYLRQNEPASPVPFLVVRALRVGEGYAASFDPSECAAPESEVRQNLRRLATEGAWAELLEQAEQAASRPEGRAWLDLHRYALRAMSESSDPDRSAAASALKGQLRALLADFPNLPDAELSDGTPTANAETRAWLRDESLLPSSDSDASSMHVPPPLDSFAESPAERAKDAEPDVWDQALVAVRAGRVGDGLQMIRRAMNSAATGRERFFRKLQLAELCLMVDNYRVALPLSEDMARLVDEFRLEEWEEEQLSARVWAALYRCLRHAAPANGSADRLQQVFTRLCRLDVNQALAYGDEPAKGSR